MPGQAAPLLQAPQLPPQPYSARTTYVAIVASDGDNMQVCASFLLLPLRILRCSASLRGSLF